MPALEFLALAWLAVCGRSGGPAPAVPGPAAEALLAAYAGAAARFGPAETARLYCDLRLPLWVALRAGRLS